MRIRKTVSSIIASLFVGLTSMTSLGTVMEKDTIIVSNGTKTVTISTNGTILINNTDIQQVISNNVFPTLGSTNIGTEGIRQIGALGGYTLEEFIEDTATRGPARDLPVFTYTTSPTKNLVVTYSGGDIYDPANGYFHLVSGSKTLVDNAVNYAYWTTADVRQVLWTTGTRPAADQAIYLGTFITSLGSIIHAGLAIGAGDELLHEDVAFAGIMPSIITEGLLVYATGTNLTNIVMSSGTEFHNMADKIVHPEVNFNVTTSMVVYCHTSGVWTTISTNLFPVKKYDNGTNLVACDSNKWYRGLFVSIANSGGLTYIPSDNVYTSAVDAIAGTDPDVPPSFTPYIPLSTAYIYAGSDSALRVESTYWLDRRFMIRRGSLTTSSSGGSANVPTFSQVLQSGRGTGGILPNGLGDPVAPDEATSKHYVDSTINNVNANKAYVDSNGNDSTALLRSSILPFKTIQAAINAASVVAATNNRYLVIVSPGSYTENVTMKNYVGVRGEDSESTVVNGTLTYPPTYTDKTGSEIALLTIKSDGTNALSINCGSDQAYVGVRSCYLVSSYSNGDAQKSVVKIYRGMGELYAATYIELNIYPTNGSESARSSQIFEHTTDLANTGLSQFTSFGSSCAIYSTDTNDNINLFYTHDNTDSGCINTFMSGMFNIYLNLTNAVYGNKICVVTHSNAIGRSLSMGNVTRLYMNETNNCSLHIGWSQNGSGENVAIIRNNHIRVVSGSSSNIWYGAATTTNDNVRIYDTEIIQKNAFSYYPRRYTALGSAGEFYLNTPHQNGDQILGGAIDFSTVNTIGAATLPEVGHVKAYCYNYFSGLEDLYLTDSSGNNARVCRDNFFNGMNSESVALQVGEPVYRAAGLSYANTPIVGRCDPANPDKMPCAGIVVQVGGITNNGIGRIMWSGRTESTFDTSAFAAGAELYVAAKTGTYSRVTATPPTGTNQVQLVGWVHTSSTSGKMSVAMWNPDMLGNKLPSAYATYANPVFSHDLFMLTNNSSARFSVVDIPAGTTNTYILPAIGGTLATYTDIQIVPVSCVVGEADGVVKGRAVYQSGAVGSRPQVKYASKNATTNLPVIGISSTSGNLGDIIEVVSFGPIRTIDTSLFSPNEMMYLGTNGILTTQSSVATDATIMMGTCTLSDPVNGSMLVNIRSYFQDGAFNGSMRYTVKNASTGATAVSSFFAMNDIGNSVRMVIRGSGNTRGPASIISANANGPIIFANNRYKPIIWDIDMTDTGDEFTHLNWPMMALVPQTGVASNAFLGIGTTNPLAMLHVNGSGIFTSTMTANQSFRGKTGAYGAAELVTYDDMTNTTTALSQRIINETNRALNAENTISNTLNTTITNLNQQLINETNRAFRAENTISNALTIADTNLGQRITTETNRAIQAENSISNVLNISITNLNQRMINETNRAIQAENTISNALNIVNTNLAQRITTETNRAFTAENTISNALNIVDTNLAQRITTETNRAFTAENTISNVLTVTITNLNQQLINETNRAIQAENIISNALNARLPTTTKRFKANIGNANITYGSALTLAPFTNVVLAATGGSIYSNTLTTCLWKPMATNGVIKLKGSWDAATANGATYIISIYKNGLLLADVYNWSVVLNMGNNTMGSTWEFVDTTTPTTNDYYRVYTTFNSSRLSNKTGTNNWWYGEVSQ